ncbi:MAG: hypothetical protein B7X93_01385 [Hydrogenophilales bacterium 17-61-9]|nr:MAG: hypothetical protein B7X93_01385 [Hydrogenophilales bacterium 17-61-9]
MSDFMRLRNAISIIDQGSLDKAWGALHWVFCSTDLEPDGFFQTVSRLGFNAERYKHDLIDRSEVARLFYYGPPADNDSNDNKQEVS